MPLRVAIIGVRGVGKFHAQWYAREGCEVVAFLSSRPDTLAPNEATLKSVLPEFCGLGYADLQEMLEAEQPDAVSVCSPHALHADHCLEVLAYGAHVLCEKPLVWLGTDRLEETLTQSGGSGQSRQPERHGVRSQHPIHGSRPAPVGVLGCPGAARASVAPFFDDGSESARPRYQRCGLVGGFGTASPQRPFRSFP